MRSNSRTSQRTGKPTFSPTRLSTFLECAVKYRYIYIDKIGRFYLRARPYYSFGATLHTVLEQFHAEGGERTADELVTDLRENWISAGYTSDAEEQEHREAGEQIVQAYHASQIERREAAAETIAVEKTITTEYDRFKLSGRIDRLDRHPDGSLEIVDYKSGRLEVTSEEIAGDLAMSVYQLILRRLYPDTRVFATIYCLRSGSQASYELAGDPLLEFEREVVSLCETILESDFESIEPERIPACEGCEFLRRCNIHWRNRARAEQLDDWPAGD